MEFTEKHEICEERERKSKQKCLKHDFKAGEGTKIKKITKLTTRKRNKLNIQIICTTTMCKEKRRKISRLRLI